MASKCTKCGDTENYNFILNIGLCDPCIGERIEELEAIEAGQLDFAKEMSRIHKNKIKLIKELKEKNEQLEKWQIKPTEAICLTDLACRYKKVFTND